MKSLTLLRMMFDDVKRQWPEHQSSLDRDFKTIEWRYRNEGFSFLAKTLPSFGDAVFASLEEGLFNCPTGFAKKGALPLFLGGLLEVVFDRRTGLLKDAKETAYILADIRQLTYVFRKALGKPRDERILDVHAKACFAETDQELTRESRDPLLQSISRRLFHPTSEQDVRRIIPRNGPGGVAEHLRSNRKYNAILGSFDPEDATRYGWSFLECVTYDYGEMPASTRKDHAILHSVPKSSTSRRTITIEPAYNMFCQQAWNGYLRDRIARSPLLSRSISLDDQSPSQEMALKSSHTRLSATVDLSAASDRLSLSLVKLCFEHDAILLDGLLRHRTAYVEIDGNRSELKKYAGMGNATTFPVQTLIFTFLSVKAIVLSEGLTLSRRDLAYALSRVRVFGDDIIIPSTAYGALRLDLETHGLKVNQRKSFVNSHFREACGLDAYDGVEITPTYVRHDLDGPSDPSFLASIISTSNQLFDRCFYRSADYLRTIVEKSLGHLPLVRKSSSGMGWTTRSDAYEPERWNKTLHRFDQRLWCLSTKRCQDRISGVPALLKFFIEKGNPMRNFESSVIRFTTVKRRRWMQA